MKGNGLVDKLLILIIVYEFPILLYYYIFYYRKIDDMSLCFSEFEWTDITLLIDKDDNYGNELGYSLDLGLQKGGYFPHMVIFYGFHQPDVHALIVEASSKSRSKYHTFMYTYKHIYTQTPILICGWPYMAGIFQ